MLRFIRVVYAMLPMLLGASSVISNSAAKARWPEQDVDFIRIKLDADAKNETRRNELELPKTPEPKNKLVLIVSAWIFGLCGIDRCFLAGCALRSQACLLGILKGATLGGCIVWFAIDLFIVWWSSWQKDKDINTFGLYAHFDDYSVDRAFTAAVIMVAFALSASCLALLVSCEKAFDERIEQVPQEAAAMGAAGEAQKENVDPKVAASQMDAAQLECDDPNCKDPNCNIPGYEPDGQIRFAPYGRSAARRRKPGESQDPDSSTTKSPTRSPKSRRPEGHSEADMQKLMEALASQEGKKDT